MKKSLLFVALMLLGMQTMFAQDYALKLSGADDQRVIMTSDAKLDLLNGATDYTIEFWAFIPSDIQKNDVLIKRKGSFAVTMYTNSAGAGSPIRRMYFTHYGASDKYRNITDDAVNLGEWNHFAIISNSVTNLVTIYVNGADVNDDDDDNTAEALKTPEVAGTDDEFVIGYDGFNDGYSSKISIDKLRITTSVLVIGDLSTTDVNTALASDTNDILVMNFDEGTGLIALNDVNSAEAAVEGGAIWIDHDAAALSLSKNNTTKFGIYPNPSINGFVSIQTQNNEMLSSVEVFNTLGKYVRTIRVDNNSKVSLDVQDLTQGLYFVRATTNNGIAIQKLVIK